MQRRQHDADLRETVLKADDAARRGFVGHRRRRESDAPVPVPNISFDDADEKKDAASELITSFNDQDESKPSMPLDVQASAKPK